MDLQNSVFFSLKSYENFFRDGEEKIFQGVIFILYSDVNI